VAGFRWKFLGGWLRQQGIQFVYGAIRIIIGIPNTDWSEPPRLTDVCSQLSALSTSYSKFYRIRIDWERSLRNARRTIGYYIIPNDRTARGLRQDLKVRTHTSGPKFTVYLVPFRQPLSRLLRYLAHINRVVRDRILVRSAQEWLQTEVLIALTSLCNKRNRLIESVWNISGQGHMLHPSLGWVDWVTFHQFLVGPVWS